MESDDNERRSITTKQKYDPNDARLCALAKGQLFAIEHARASRVASKGGPGALEK